MSSISTNSNPLVSILILNWNGARYLPRCLDSVAAQSFKDFEVIVLDNASTDHSVEGIEDRYPGFRKISFEQNLGFAIANNRGAQIATGEWLAFLNNDAFPQPDWLKNIVAATREYPQFDFFSSRLIYDTQADMVQSTGDVYNISGYAWPRDNNNPINQAHDAHEEVFSACAAAALYKRKAFLAAGGFTEAFSSHHEDVDLGFRLRLLGHRCLYVPDAVVAHVGSASYGQESDRTVYQVQRNVIWSFVTNMPGKLFWKYLPAHIFANLVFLAYYSLRGQAKTVWKAKWDALRALAEIMKARKRIQSKCQINPEGIDEVMDHQWLGPFLLGKNARKIRLILGRSSELRH
jgi:GT2 family glycosyltransferase